MRRTILAALVMMGVVGCGREDPATSRLAPGREAIVTGPKDPGEAIGVAIESPRAHGPLPGMGAVNFGAKVRIVRDEELDDDPPGNRPVLVLVLDGTQEGVDGKIRRKELRPAR